MTGEEWLADLEGCSDDEGTPILDWTPEIPMATPMMETGLGANGDTDSALFEMCSQAQEHWKVNPHTFLADTGASSHMGPGDTGMFDVEEHPQTQIKFWRCHFA